MSESMPLLGLFARRLVSAESEPDCLPGHRERIDLCKEDLAEYVREPTATRPGTGRTGAGDE